MCSIIIHLKAHYHHQIIQLLHLSLIPEVVVRSVPEKRHRWAWRPLLHAELHQVWLYEVAVGAAGHDEVVGSILEIPGGPIILE